MQVSIILPKSYKPLVTHYSKVWYTYSYSWGKRWCWSAASLEGKPACTSVQGALGCKEAHVLIPIINVFFHQMNIYFIHVKGKFFLTFLTLHYPSWSYWDFSQLYPHENKHMYEYENQMAVWKFVTWKIGGTKIKRVNIYEIKVAFIL